MSDTARDYQTIDTVSTEGLEQIFEAEVVPGSTLESQVLPTEGVPVDLAAKQLGLSPKTVKDRLRKGTLAGFKVKDKFGERWLVSLGATELVVPGTTETIGSGSPSQVAPTNVLVAATEQETTILVDVYKEQIKDLQAKLEAATYRLGYLEHQVETQEDQLKLLTDSQHEPGWWARFSRWFFKGG